MDFFRKHFTNILIGILILVALATVLPRFFSNNDTLPQQIVTPDEIKEYEPPFEHEGNLSFYKKDNTLIKTFDVEFARTERETELGLMYRKSMKENQGMLFVFHEEKPRSFWMKNTYIPLDIIYLDKDKHIVSIAKNAEPLSETSRPSEGNAMYVLEINAGLSDKLGLTKGDYMTFESLID
ncbi:MULTISPECIES: DUF192 domain-containing protein [unclassified Capnocytophaga]|jgi:uncharacterized ACR, COG1430|uniref:DUF192 domain-containing protein n=1 Tax=unclassified Capnocytophaga TaxID=2640652 RepID=UPI000202E4FC|nr:MULTISPECIES: DUF192 domain-containing protein [unclassified Capnocytophaga]EGD33241.1 protein of hypothetical function DUF192 [Capnocytophaga sp. oral taxon 338 str. F0234]MEB3005678.1 DUF192 domain-containing protein [Capnocytophaga sp. G2]